MWSGVSVSIKTTADPQSKKDRQLHHSAKLRSNLMWNYIQLTCHQATQIIKPIWLYTIFLVAWCLSMTMDRDNNFYYLTFSGLYRGLHYPSLHQWQFLLGWLASKGDLTARFQGLTSCCYAYRAGTSHHKHCSQQLSYDDSATFPACFWRSSGLLRSFLYLHRQASMCVSWLRKILFLL